MRTRRNNRREKRNFIDFEMIKSILTIIVIIVFIIFLYNIMANTRNQEKEIAENKSQNQVQTNETNMENEEQPKNQTEENKIETLDKTITIAATGDIMCHSDMYKDAYDSSDKTYDFSYMFDNIKYYVQTADITIGNLETTFAGKDKGYSGYPTFNTPEQLAKNLKTVGFDVVSTANNHCMDKGYKGLESTINYLDDADLEHTGTYKSKEDSEKILIKDVKGVKIAFLSYTYGTNGIKIPKDKSYCVNLIDKDLMKKQIKQAKEDGADVVCVSMHWGTEYQEKPNSTQQDLAKFLIENGADIIIGNHPHVLQKMEKLDVKLDDGSTKTGFVAYSLGNFMASQNKKGTKDSAILNIKITKKADGKISIDKIDYTPIYFEKDNSKSKNKFEFIDLKQVIGLYEENTDKSIGEKKYKNLKSELKYIENILGDE